MMYRVSGALIASIGAVTLLLAADGALARSGATVHAGFAPTHSHFRSRLPNAHAFRHHRRNGIDGIGGFWGGGDDFGYGPIGEPGADLSGSAVPDLRATCTYHIPWDWVHRCPPAVTPTERAYAPSCSNEAVTVPGSDGKESTVNVTRCY